MDKNHHPDMFESPHEGATDPATAAARLLSQERLTVFPSGPRTQPTAQRPFRRLLSAAGLALAIGIGLAAPAQAAPSPSVLQAVQAVPTAESVRIDRLQHRFGQAGTAPIVYVDADAADIEISLAASEGERVSLAEALIRQIRDAAGITLDGQAATALGNKLAGTGDAGTFFMFRGQGIADGGNAVCIVLPSSPESAFPVLAGALAGITADALKLDIGLEARAAYAALRDFTDLHETSHCLDQRYAPRMLGPDPNGTQRHKAEMFADVHAALLMARDGRPEAARLVMDLRNIALVARHAAMARADVEAGRHPAAGMAYAIGGGLAAANELIARDGESIRRMSDEALLKTAYLIVETAALSAESRAILGLTLAGVPADQLPAADPLDQSLAQSAKAAVDLSIARRIDQGRLSTTAADPVEASRFQPTPPGVARTAGALAGRGNMIDAARVIAADRDHRRDIIAAVPVKGRP